LETNLEIKMKTLLLTIIIAFPTLSAIGQTADNYQKARQINVLSDKKRFVLGLKKEDRLTVFRRHVSVVSATEDLTPEQAEFLPRSLDAYERDEMTEELEQEALDIFTPELADKVFIPGPYTQAVTIIPKVSVFGFAPPRVDCNCRQTGTNFGCRGWCDASGCSPTIGGCSIWWAYPCDGTCSGKGKSVGCVQQRRREGKG
jgi:hypothetical protein